MGKSYVIDIPKLELGDVILTSEKGVVSKGVRVATLSKYSHAAIYVGGTIIEATLGGVFSKNPQRLIFNSEKQVAVYRYREPLNQTEIKSICGYARSKVASLYTLPEAATLRYRDLLKIPESRKQFCSRLVALAYSDNGIDLANIRNPAYCTPKQLSLCKAFYKVNGIIREANEGDIEFAKTDDPNILHQKETINWVNKVRKLVNKEGLEREYDIQSITDVDKFLRFNSEFDDKIVGYLKSEGYLTHYNFDTKRNPYRYSLALLESAFIVRNDKDEFLNEQLVKENNIINLYSENLDRYLHYFLSKNINYYREHCVLYINLLTGIYTRMKFVNELAVKFSYDNAANISGEYMRVAGKNIMVANEIIGSKLGA
ncbi:hypothetical protein GNP79_19210 [Aliivibrio fischeri]|uniref:Permuted papain-like amidase enzyme, YaeF/YiiX, C92 family n=1 Tax=Aliivibrio fischeri TaxID=668 RepID=A0A6N3Z6Z3_ALIFS|nr:YiiX/YebB-like N1pC/P60 family cysteine hydrolase [Aliivibrio fischeri]MUK47564.1 hypothetical protein [Aliivibrio fischeri]MUK82913.1 hypothetical protein [Aliivibrio fischeri]MUK86756.1 hypothetical protein [Aliivibrio fischeri]